VAECIRGWIAGEPLNLIEALAVRIAEDVLAKFPVSAVDITVHKPQAPIAVEFGDVSVSVHRVAQERP
jgi:dihydroneopterin aldolase